MITTNANTIPVVCSVSLRVGHDDAAGFGPRLLREREEFLARASTATRRHRPPRRPPMTISTRSTSASSLNW